MKKAGRWIVLISVVLALVELSSLGFALDTKDARKTLGGLQGVWVLIEALKIEIERDGLTMDQLQTDTELKLRMAGIKILSRIEQLETPGMPYLYVHANIMRSKYGYRYVYRIEVSLNQDVSLIRSPNIKIDAVTWSVAAIGITNELKDIRTQTKDLVDKFINAYLSVNQK